MWGRYLPDISGWQTEISGALMYYKYLPNQEAASSIMFVVTK